MHDGIVSECSDMNDGTFLILNLPQNTTVQSRARVVVNYEAMLSCALEFASSCIGNVDPRHAMPRLVYILFLQATRRADRDHFT